MYSYQIVEWILFFYIYCVFGWIFESTYVSLKSKKFVNRGFMKGPMIPIYGEGAIMMVIATYPVRGNIPLEFIMGMVGATLLEFVVGAIMEYVFKVKYWDYSNQPFNVKGYICLSSTICWGVLSVLLAELIHIPIERFVLSINDTVQYGLVLCVSALFVFDAVTSAKEAWDLRILLVALTKAKEEIVALQHQLEVKKDQIAEQLTDKKEELVEQLTDYKEEITSQLVDKKEELFEDLQAKKEYIVQSLKKGSAVVKEAESLKKKIDDERKRYQAMVEKLSLPNVRILRRNPGATSKKFYEALESVKEHLEIKRKNK